MNIYMRVAISKEDWKCIKLSTLFDKKTSEDEILILVNDVILWSKKAINFLNTDLTYLK